MRYSIASAATALFVSQAVAFPGMVPGGMDGLTTPLAQRAYEQKLKRQTAAAPQGAGALPATPPPFDAKAQYVSNQGAYAVSCFNLASRHITVG